MFVVEGVLKILESVYGKENINRDTLGVSFFLACAFVWLVCSAEKFVISACENIEQEQNDDEREMVGNLSNEEAIDDIFDYI